MRTRWREDKRGRGGHCSSAVEQRFRKPQVVGSNPTGGSIAEGERDLPSPPYISALVQPSQIRYAACNLDRYENVSMGTVPT